MNNTTQMMNSPAVKPFAKIATAILMVSAATTEAFIAPYPTSLRLTANPPSKLPLNMLPSPLLLQTIAAATTVTTTTTTTATKAAIIPSLLLSDGLSAATYANDLSGPLSTLRLFFIVAIGSIFGITALAYLTAAFLIPRAAQQLERDTKRLRPDLWEEYQAKLGEGESMVNRPDLLQELGNLMQPIIVSEYEREAAETFGSGKKASDSDSESGRNSRGVNGASAPLGKVDEDGVVDVSVRKAEAEEGNQWKD
ncbi:hypothetical protein ACHAXS_003764 [Conticribra weissflogii]